jgi:hypothetical protein
LAVVDQFCSRTAICLFASLKLYAGTASLEGAHMTQIDAGRDGDGLRRYHMRGEADDQFRPSAVSRGSPEGLYLAGRGKSLNRHITELKDRRAGSAAQDAESRAALESAESQASEREAQHRGGDHSWLLRLLIGLALVAEGVTAFVGMEVLVPSVTLAVGLAALAALVGAGMACVLANRRLNRLHVPASARLLEGVFVGVLTALRYDSLHIQGADWVAAAGGAALAALISALALLGIEEVLVETHTFRIFASKVQVAYRRRRCRRAAARLRRIQARIEAAAENLQQHFLDFLLREDVPLDEAQQRAAALRRALVDSGA